MEDYIVSILALIIGIAIWCAKRWRDKVIEALPPKIDAVVTSFGATAFIMVFFWPFLKSHRIEIKIILFIFIFVIAFTIYYRIALVDRKLVSHNISLVDRVCQFVASYEAGKPNYSDQKKQAFLTNNEKHEQQFAAEFNKNVLPYINKAGIIIPNYMVRQRRWGEVRDLVLKHERKN